MAHDFPASIQWQCLREVIAAVRKGPSNLSRDEKIDVGQHLAYFWGSSLEWYRKRDVSPDDDSSLLSKLLDLFRAKAVFGDELASESTEDLCDRCEAAMPAEGTFGEEEGSVLTILSIVIPILIELWKRFRDEDEGGDDDAE